jgi:hypothetical protein
MSQPAISDHLADVIYSISGRGVPHAVRDDDTEDGTPAPLGVSADSLDQTGDGVVESRAAAWVDTAIHPERGTRAAAPHLD